MKPLFLLFVFALVLSPTTHAQTWRLDSSQSNLHIISTKNTHIAEVHHFSQFSGAYDSAKGQFSLLVDSSSLATGVDIRDQRIQESVLQPTVSKNFMVHGTLDSTVFSKVIAGNTQTVSLASTLLFLNNSYPINLELTLSPRYNPQSNTAESVSVRSTKPVIINAKQLGLQEGIDHLQKLANLKAISYSIPVTFEFLITPAQAN